MLLLLLGVLKWNKCINSLSWLGGFFCLFYILLLLMRASKGRLCVCVSVLVCQSIHLSILLVWGIFFESFLCSIISIVCCSWSALERKLCFMDFLQVCCWSSLLGFCFKINALDSCQNIARKKIATENSSSVLLEMHQSTGETTDSSMGLMHSDPPQNLLLLPLYLF